MDEMMQVYQPREDTRLLLTAALSDVRSGERVLEVGTGSGIIAAELAKTAHVVATDINPHAVAAARSLGVEVIRTDLFAGICGSFDLVIFNPPYLPTEARERIDDWLEYALDGGRSGRDVIECFARDVGRVLMPFGRVLFLISSLTGLYEVQQVFSDLGFTCFVVAKESLEGEVLYVLRVMRHLCPMRQPGA